MSTPSPNSTNEFIVNESNFMVIRSKDFLAESKKNYNSLISEDVIWSRPISRHLSTGSTFTKSQLLVSSRGVGQFYYPNDVRAMDWDSPYNEKASNIKQLSKVVVEQLCKSVPSSKVNSCMMTYLTSHCDYIGFQNEKGTKNPLDSQAIVFLGNAREISFKEEKGDRVVNSWIMPGDLIVIAGSSWRLSIPKTTKSKCRDGSIVIWFRNV